MVEPAVVEEGVEIILMEDEDTVEILDSQPSHDVSFKNTDGGCAQRPPPEDHSDTVDRGAAQKLQQKDHTIRSGSLNTVMEGIVHITIKSYIKPGYYISRDPKLLKK